MEEEELSRYFVNGYGQLALMVLPEGYPPIFFSIEGVNSETLLFVMERIV